MVVLRIGDFYHKNHLLSINNPMSTTFQSYCDLKQVDCLLESISDGMIKQGLDPVPFFEKIGEDPSILEDQERLDELWDWARKGAAGLGAGISGWNAGNRAKQASSDVQRLRTLQQNNPAAFNAKYNSQHIQDLDQQRADAASQAGKGFFSNFGAGWNKKGEELGWDRLDQRLGVGAYSPTNMPQNPPPLPGSQPAQANQPAPPQPNMAGQPAPSPQSTAQPSPAGQPSPSPKPAPAGGSPVQIRDALKAVKGAIKQKGGTNASQMMNALGPIAQHLGVRWGSPRGAASPVGVSPAAGAP